jgi:hypothetical protein
VLVDRPNWPQHRPWLIVLALAGVGAFAWWWVASLDLPEWAGGSSLPGFTFGVVGGLIIVFEFLLWLRRKVRVWRIGSAQTWLRAHIWLGLFCLPLLIMHSGLRWGGTLSTALMVLLILVIASGVWGLLLQNVLPKRMGADLPAETVYAQRDFLVQQLLAQADQLVCAACGTANEVGSHAEESTPAIVGATRLPASGLPTAAIPESGPLAVFYRDKVVPFLREGSAGDSLLANASSAAQLFQHCKAQVPPAAHGIVDAMESFCQQRRRWDSQARLHYWLHNWLWVHFPLSVALLVLMVVHVFVALKFW